MKEFGFRERDNFSPQNLNLRKASGMKPFIGIFFPATLITNLAQFFFL